MNQSAVEPQPSWVLGTWRASISASTVVWTAASRQRSASSSSTAPTSSSGVRAAHNSSSNPASCALASATTPAGVNGVDVRSSMTRLNQSPPTLTGS